MGQFGQYEVLSELGRGAAGVVYRARDSTHGGEVALKVLLEARPTELSLERFRREGEITVRLEHPGIVKLLAAGTNQGRPFLAYELVPSAHSLGEVLPHAAPERKLQLIRDAARALGHAHEQGVIHRDVKAENILVDLAGQVRVADFGIAAARGLERITVQDALVGTPHAMAPEQVAGDRDALSPATDVWALGVLLYEAFAGVSPFDADSLVTLIHRVTSTEPQPLPVDLPYAVGPICDRALRKKPEERYTTANDFADALDALLAKGEQTEPSSKPPVAIVVVGVALVALVALTLALVLRGEPATPPPADPPVVDPPIADPPTADPPTDPPTADPEAPGWYRVLPVADRPPLPLPAGVKFGEEPGDWINEKDGTVLRWIPPGFFRMGNPDEEADEGPQRRVTFAEGYFVSKHETTWGQFRRFCEATGRGVPPNVQDLRRVGGEHFTAPDDHPVFGVTWNGAVAYCEWAGLRLPTESEWEYAARGPSNRVFPWGDQAPDATRANAADQSGSYWSRHAALGRGQEQVLWNDGFPNTAPVGSFPAGASPFGCLNMAGNVSEWVEDNYRDNYRVAALDGSPMVRPGAPRVFRGGSWRFGALFLRAACRHKRAEKRRLPFLGFRPARSLR